MDKWQDYLDNLDENKKVVLIDFLNKCEKFIPNAEKVMKYGVPTLLYKNVPILGASANKEHLGVYPYGGETIEKIKDFLTDADFSKGTIRFKYDNLPNDDLVKLIIETKLNLIKKQAFTVDL